MKRKQFYLVNLMVFLGLFMGAQNICHGLEVGVAEPVPGFSPTRWVSFNYVTPDAQLMLFQVWDPYWRIKSSTWDANLQQWTSPQELPTDPPGGFPTSMIASLSPDGMTMYYGDGIQGGVCLSRKTENGWKLPPGLAELVPNLDPAPSDTYFNGNFFYTTHFYNDIWFSTYDDVNDEFSPSIPVESINTSEWSEQGAWISRDSTLLVFSSNRDDVGYGGYDLYSATWDEDLRIWTNITNLGSNVNTSLDEYGSCMAEEAGILFFERHDPITDQRQPMHAVVEAVPVVEIDIKPGSCPNPLNVQSKGVLPVAILGSEDFNVTTIDVASIRLADVAPIRSSYEDVATPFEGELCDCHTLGPDGYTDLALKFKTQQIVNALGEVVDGEVLQLTLTGNLLEGTAIEGKDCIIVLSKGGRSRGK